jgi:hypothetical protein
MNAPVLSLSGVTTTELFGRSGPKRTEFLVQPGELVLVDSRDATMAADFADLCCGLRRPDEGTVQFLGHDWALQPD